MTTTRRQGRPLAPRLCRVRVRLCASRCLLCHEQHDYTDVMDAERVDRGHVRITQPDNVWLGAVISRRDFEFVEEP